MTDMMTRNEVMDEMTSSQESFWSSTQEFEVKPWEEIKQGLGKQPKGYINIIDFFDNKNIDGDFETIDELPTDDDITYSQLQSDYTYNFGGMFSSDFQYYAYQGSNDEVYIFVDIHIGMDARVGFTDKFIVNVPSMNDWYYMLDYTVVVADVEYTTSEGGTDYIAIDATGYRDNLEAYVNSTGDVTEAFDYMWDSDEDILKSAKEAYEGRFDVEEVTKVTVY